MAPTGTARPSNIAIVAEWTHTKLWTDGGLEGKLPKGHLAKCWVKILDRLSWIMLCFIQCDPCTPLCAMYAMYGSVRYRAQVPLVREHQTHITTEYHLNLASSFRSNEDIL